jgi:glucose/arabinose dehydrogenase
MESVSRHKGIAVGAVLAVVMAVGYVATTNSDPTNEVTEEAAIHIATVADGLHNPWSLAFLPDGRILVTEKFTGHLRIISDGKLEAEPLTNLPKVHAKAQGGLLEVALHPQFEKNGTIYLSYAKPGDFGTTTALALAHFDGKTVTDYRDIFIARAWSFDNGQYGGKIAFDAQGLLYLAVGDRRDRPRRAQDTSDHAGKIVRLRADGSVPDDNPFVGNANYLPEIFALGMRNQYGLVRDAQTGNLFELEMGPQGGDELNLIAPGKNYGWPVVTYGREYSGALINGGLREKAGMEQPLVNWVPSISPAGLAVYRGDRFPRWKGNLFAGSHGERHLRRIVLEGTKVVHQETLLARLGEQVRDVREGPDGLIYIVTDGEAGKILRIEPRP